MSQEQGKIYIVEDDMTIVSLLKDHLSASYHVSSVSNFRDVKQEIIAFQPDLILMDITLPYFNGFYWTAELRKFLTIPIIFISSSNDEMDMVMALNMGGDDFISKPFSLAVLDAKLTAILRRSQQFIQQELTFGGFTLTREGLLSSQDKEVILSPTEREHLIWYILYIMMFVLFFISFYLYHLPMPYLFNSLGLNVIVLLGISIWQYSRYRKKMLHLKYFNSSQDPSFELQPSDYAYFNIITQLEAREAQKVSETIEQTNHVALMIKMWSHQMKVPLAAISLMAQTNHLDPKEVEQQLLKLQHYLETLLAFLKFRQYRDDFRFEAVSLREVVVEIIKSYKVICLSKSLSIIIEGDNIWKTDKKWLTFALSQVLDNAIKYSNPESKIIISIGEESIRIQDYGIGILEEDIPRLFEDGFTGYNGHEHQKATGMGLYMTKEVLSSLNLSISVDSKINYGTAVSIHK